MGLAVRERAADALHKDSAALTRNRSFALLRGERRVALQKLFCVDEGDFPREAVAGIRVLVPDLMLHVLDNREDALYGVLEHFDASVLFANHALPVPLIHIAGVEVVRLFIAADGVHVCVEALARLEAVAL